MTRATPASHTEAARRELAELEAEMALQRATVAGYTGDRLTEHLRQHHALALRRVALLAEISTPYG